MGELASVSPPPPATAAALLQVVFADGDRSVDLGTVTVQPSLGVRKLQAVVADRVGGGVAPHQISACLARPRRTRRVPLDEAATPDLAAAVAREGAGCYVLASLRRSRRDRRGGGGGGGRSRRERKAAGGGGAESLMMMAAAAPERTILKRLPPTDLASLASSIGPAPPMPSPSSFGAAWDYEAQLRELQRQREWYLMSTAAADPYLQGALLLPDREDLLWQQQQAPQRSSSCPECDAAAAALRSPAFHWCVRDAVTVGFRSPVGPIERPSKKSPSPSPSPSPPPPPQANAPARLVPSFAAGVMPVCY